jgi:hypothetical protein
MPTVPAAGYDTGPSAPQPIRPEVPEDFLRVQATPEAFGAAVGGALSRAGEIGERGAGELAQAAISRQQFYNSVAADNASTQYMKQSHDILFGAVDPVTGTRSKGYYGLQGQDVVQYGSPTERLDKLQQDIANSLPNQAARLQFNSETRRLRTYEDAEIGRHYNEQLKVAGAESQQAKSDLALRDANLYHNDPNRLAEILERNRNAAMGLAQIKFGMALDDATKADVIKKADDATYKSAIGGYVAAGDYAGAKAMHDAHPGIFTGEEEEAFNRTLQPHFDREIGERAGRAALGGSGGGQFRAPPGPHPFNLPVAGATADEQQMLNEIRYRESTGNYTLAPNEKGASGAFQFIPDTWKEATAAAGQGTEYDAAYKAPKEVQDAVALNWLRQKGTAPWAPSGPYPAMGRAGAQGTLQADFAKRSGAFGTPEEAAKNLTTITAPGGASFQVNKLAAPQIQGFVNELAGMGYKIDPAHSSGYNNRNKVGVDTDEKSEHAYGTAIDINDDRNKQDDKLITDLPPNVGDIAAKWGLKWGGAFDGKKDAMHFEVARLLPAGSTPATTQVAAATPTTVTDVPPGAPPAAPGQGLPGTPVTPPAATTLPEVGVTAPAAPAATAASARPTGPPLESLETLLGRIPTTDPKTGQPLTEEQQRRAENYVVRTYHEQRQRIEESRARLVDSLNNGIQMLKDGHDFAYDEATIRSLLEPPQADEAIQKLADAKLEGAAMNKVSGMTAAETIAERNRLQAGVESGPPTGYVQRRKEQEAFEKALSVHYNALMGEKADPANYVAVHNPRIAALQTAKDQNPQAASDYATATLAEQARLGVPTVQQHVLTKNDALNFANGIAANPEDAPKVLAGMAAHWGSAWGHVWSDLVTEGKLPAGYQVVGQLADYDPDNAAVLARALGAEHKDDKAFEKAISDKTTRAGKSIKQITGETIPGDPRVTDYTRSLYDSGASPAQVTAITGAIEHLAAGRVLFKHEDPSEASQKAIDAVVGHYVFMPNGGARVPADRESDVGANARVTLEGLSLDNVAVPARFAGAELTDPGAVTRPGAATEPKPQSYIDMVKAAPTWVTGPKADRLLLLDPAGRLVTDKTGAPISVPFAQGPPAMALPPAGTPYVAPMPH